MQSMSAALACSWCTFTPTMPSGSDAYTQPALDEPKSMDMPLARLNGPDHTASMPAMVEAQHTIMRSLGRRM